ncbi:hypothetical protein HS1genome_2026 [Sulfodiicoccus acidiphilus]|uniref:MIP18 family-like domain-containing protein n=1 Tax=Sulfodiicoccus acidiphilus TaxID=1670455 RepID=A0A348B635_9CREN|nr:metal-sulfur cluster assembly factor [Sulfodiicoccus acidiphilus]BBD73637.1 hypothetical protein HS1genome_2026 [Sulfodiicoccus acidiphilus]GGU02142.1 hypothetical protein GCM10007116_19090 [Sulfodiicoccus acidiphilus]
MSKTEWKKSILDGLREVYDPEIPINVVDLGLVYELEVNEEGDVYLRIGATTPSCPVTEDLVYTVELVVRERVPARSVQVDLDLETRWTPFMMTPEGRKAFQRSFGYDIVERWSSRAR